MLYVPKHILDDYAVAFRTLSLSLISLNSGNRIRMIAITVIGPEIGRSRKIMGSPLENRSDWRSFGSAIGPSTMASTAGATG